MRHLSLLVGRRVLGDVAHEVRLHFVIEHFSFVSLHIWHQRVLEEVKNVLANAGELALDLLLVVLDFLDVLSVALDVLLLLNGGEHTPGRTSRANHVLEGDSQDVSLLYSELLRA